MVNNLQQFTEKWAVIKPQLLRGDLKLIANSINSLEDVTMAHGSLRVILSDINSKKQVSNETLQKLPLIVAAASALLTKRASEGKERVAKLQSLTNGI